MNYTHTGSEGFSSNVGLFIFLLVLVVAVLAIYLCIVRPFMESRDYIKMEMNRSEGMEREYWEYELIELYYGWIPIIGSIMRKRYKKGRKKMECEKICAICETGKKLMELDPNQPFCPYLPLYQDNHCPMFKPIIEENK